MGALSPMRVWDTTSKSRAFNLEMLRDPCPRESLDDDDVYLLDQKIRGLHNYV
jgi:hypothetical protein